MVTKMVHAGSDACNGRDNACGKGKSGKGVDEVEFRG